MAVFGNNVEAMFDFVEMTKFQRRFGNKVERCFDSVAVVDGV